ncbi:Rha family transcriptional regulator [Candidatus Woesebacteria bacterium]|nr:Rha family transcriptional regulator [Candidatus Woesebacteria bacterium]
MVDLVVNDKGENWTTSNLVAERLRKPHKHVLEKIRKLLLDLENLTAKNLATKNDSKKFILEDYINERGQTYSRYKLNRPAFTLLMMQMSGKKAFEVQEAFNEAFYEMERYILKMQNTEFIAAREQSKVARLEITDSIKELVEYATAQGSKHANFYYSTITNETYKALGYLAKGEKVGSEFRNHLDKFQLHELVMAEAWAARVIKQSIEAGLHYKEIYLLAKQKVVEFGKSQDNLRLK